MTLFRTSVYALALILGGSAVVTVGNLGAQSVHVPVKTACTAPNMADISSTDWTCRSTLAARECYNSNLPPEGKTLCHAMVSSPRKQIISPTFEDVLDANAALRVMPSTTSVAPVVPSIEPVRAKVNNPPSRTA